MPRSRGKPMRRAVLVCSCVLAAFGVTGPAHAGELFGGLYVHDVKLPTDKSGIERGADAMLGYRGGKIFGTPLQPYVFGALNSAGGTSYAAAGLSAKFGKSIYFRPGIGIAIHNGSAKKLQDLSSDRIELGSRRFFEPEGALGRQTPGRLSTSSSWVPLSHAQFF